MLPAQIQQIRQKAEQGQPESQFLLSQICQQQNDLEGMIHWLSRATEAGLPNAHAALGLCREKGHGISRDYEAALGHYDIAVDGGAVPAMYHKADLLHKAERGEGQASLIKDLLRRAAANDFVPALRAVGYLAMQKPDSKELAQACLQRAAQAGDPVSAFNLAWFYLRADTDDAPAKAFTWLKVAAEAQYPYADALLAPLSSRSSTIPPLGPDSVVDWTVDFPIYPESSAARQQVLSTDPPVTLFENVLDVPDCAYLMWLSKPSLQRAKVIDPDKGIGGMVSDVRTSESTYIPFHVVDIIARFVESKITLATGEDLRSSEPMSILRYSPGEYYRPHFDYFDPKLDGTDGLMEDGGQRTASAVTYLTAPEAGGSTSFPELNLTTPATAGGTLWFRNCFDNGRIDERSLHAGDPVEAGEKWVVTKWFRQRPTRYFEF